MRINIDILNTTKKTFWNIFYKKMDLVRNVNQKTDEHVKKIVGSVKKNGDKALLKFINKYDGYKTTHIKSVRISKKEIFASFGGLFNKSSLSFLLT